MDQFDFNSYYDSLYGSDAQENIPPQTHAQTPTHTPPVKARVEHRAQSPLEARLSQLRSSLPSLPDAARGAHRSGRSRVRRPAFLDSLTSSLPSLWGIDLVFAIATAGAVISTLLNWQAVSWSVVSNVTSILSMVLMIAALALVGRILMRGVFRRR